VLVVLIVAVVQPLQAGRSRILRASWSGAR
jgi:hypothetical protein